MQHQRNSRKSAYWGPDRKLFYDPCQQKIHFSSRTTYYTANLYSALILLMS